LAGASALRLQLTGMAAFESSEESGVRDERGGLPFIAYHLGPKPGMRIVAASRWRDWMNETYRRTANRCLPLLVANEAGWFLLNERRFTAEWSGGQRLEDVAVRYDGVKPTPAAASNFGEGVLTFPIPYLFRTPPGFDLLVRGPTNLPRDGIAALDGLVETDWTASPFTMNWKFTRPGQVTFEARDPICMVLPIRRHDPERFEPAIRAAQDADDDTGARWEAAVRSRHELLVSKFLAPHSKEHREARDAWESDYFRGRAPEHMTKRRLKPFAKRS
jgi:hypothetical protein